jgi:hypothetical protein
MIAAFDDLYQFIFAIMIVCGEQRWLSSRDFGLSIVFVLQFLAVRFFAMSAQFHGCCV